MRHDEGYPQEAGQALPGDGHSDANDHGDTDGDDGGDKEEGDGGDGDGKG